MKYKDICIIINPVKWGIVVENVLYFHKTKPENKGKENAMLTGEFRHSVDSKNRLFIPAKMRDELGDSFIIARDMRGKRLKVYSLTGWEEYIAPIKAQERKIAEKALRYLHRNAAQVSPDSQGRVLLGEGLIEYAEIKKEVVIVGCSSYAEIWSAPLYDEEMLNEDFADICATLEQFVL